MFFAGYRQEIGKFHKIAGTVRPANLTCSLITPQPGLLACFPPNAALRKSPWAWEGPGQAPLSHCTRNGPDTFTSLNNYLQSQTFFWHMMWGEGNFCQKLLICSGFSPFDRCLDHFNSYFAMLLSRFIGKQWLKWFYENHKEMFFFLFQEMCVKDLFFSKLTNPAAKLLKM